MKILILGATGMLGHRLFIELSKHHEVWGTVRNLSGEYPEFLRHKVVEVELYSPDTTYDLHLAFSNVKPDVVINCTAAIPQHGYPKAYCVAINALTPNVLAEYCEENNARLIHFSTDGVFSGKDGDYSEDDTPDATDVYGMTKRLGEISDQKHVLTLRCCPIGREIGAKKSLVEWFLAQTGTVKGYTNAWFSPLTTHEVARMLNQYVLPRSDLHGLYHVGDTTISKSVLLELIRDTYELDTAIIPDSSVDIDRTLMGTRLFTDTGYRAPIWEKMIDEMAADNALYEGVKA